MDFIRNEQFNSGMVDRINIDINRRFYEAFDKLASAGIFGSKNSFFTEFNIDKRNFNAIRTSDSRRVDARLLSILVSKFNVSAHWLLTGEGRMFGVKK